MKNKWVKTVWEYGKIVILAFFISAVFKAFVLERMVVPTGSMLPTIPLNDHILVEKLSFYYRDVQRGDIVVFRPPDTIDDTGAPWVKRVIGLPGEALKIKDGHVYINDEPLYEPYIQEKSNYSYGPIIIPNDAYFMMGDNRNNSIDSHYWGPLSKERMIGRVILK